MKTQLPEPAGPNNTWAEDQVRAVMVAAYLEGVEESKAEIERHIQEVDASRERIEQDEALLRECYETIRGGDSPDIKQQLKQRLGL